MRKHVICGLVLGLMLLTPAAARAQFEMIQPVDFTGFLSHPGYELGGWFMGADFLFLQKIFGNYNGTAPDSMLSVGYRMEDGTVFQFSWFDQWFSNTPNPTDTLQILEFTTRIETYKTDTYRQYATFGPRAILTSLNFNLGKGRSLDIDNNMVGLFIGVMNEWYLGTNPLGAFSFTLDADVGAYGNFVREGVGIGAGTVLSEFTLSGSFQVRSGIIWYAWEGITVHLGLELLSVINLTAPESVPTIANNAINYHLVPTMPVWLGFYFGFGFVF